MEGLIYLSEYSNIIFKVELQKENNIKKKIIYTERKCIYELLRKCR